MLAQSLRFPAEAAPLRHGDWVYERKLDGLRCIAVRDGDRVELWSRNHLPWNRRFPGLVAELAALPVGALVLDGEIVAFDDADRTSFQLLQGSDAAVPVLVAFDLLHLLGRDTMGLPLLERADLLRRTVATAGGDRGRLRVSEHLAGGPDELMSRACGSGWEGLVAKRALSTYHSGRSPDWRKVKCTARQELVIGGWTDPGGARTGFGALLVGYHEGGRLVYAGKVGTGFDERTLRALHGRLLGLEAQRPPFDDAPRERGAHWVRPDLVAEIAFTEWTRDGRLRHPSFLGLREDKPAAEVVREVR
ncbi:MAG TPA: non-homologous end-joining DNA ligase [Acidimicrobiales bacterium]|nr:non-homologous end-joining DNA ligase [Acidimicrobiales bacterium]